MSVLVVLLPSRSAAGAGAPSPGPAGGSVASAAEEWDWVLSADGAGVGARGRGRAATLPACDRLVLALEPAALGWHRVELPRVAPARLRAALEGLLEEALLDEPSQLHLALEPGAAPGQPAWVAVLRRERLADALATLEASGREVDRGRRAVLQELDLQAHCRLPIGDCRLPIVRNGPRADRVPGNRQSAIGNWKFIRPAR